MNDGEMNDGSKIGSNILYSRTKKPRFGFFVFLKGDHHEKSKIPVSASEQQLHEFLGRIDTSLQTKSITGNFA
jgi:hypothetical protein